MTVRDLSEGRTGLGRPREHSAPLGSNLADCAARCPEVDPEGKWRSGIELKRSRTPVVRGNFLAKSTRRAPALRRTSGPALEEPKLSMQRHSMLEEED